MTNEPKFKSDAYEAIHSSASGMFRLGAMDQATMRRFGERCLNRPEGESKHADHPSVIALSAKDSEAFVTAFSNPREPGEKMRERVASYMARAGDESE